MVVTILGVGYFTNQLSVSTTPSVPVSKSVEGLVLNSSISSKTIRAGDSLGISISLYNTLPRALNISAVPSYNSTSWRVSGFPVAMWGGCYFFEPVEFVVVRGNLSLGQLHAASANSTYPAIGCLEGGSVSYVSFHPESSNVTTTGSFCISACEPVHPSYNLTSSFSVNGYWGYPLNQSEAGDIYTPSTASCYSSPGQSVSCGVTYNYPEVGPIAQHLFTPGVYTLVVSDEWGQTALLHFSVV